MMTPELKPQGRNAYVQSCKDLHSDFYKAHQEAHSCAPLRQVVYNRRDEPVGLVLAFLDLESEEIKIGWSRCNVARLVVVDGRLTKRGDIWNKYIGFKGALDSAQTLATMPEWIDATDKETGRRLVPDSISDRVKRMCAWASEVWSGGKASAEIDVCRAVMITENGIVTKIEPTNESLSLTTALNQMAVEVANAIGVTRNPDNSKLSKGDVKEAKRIVRTRRRRLYVRNLKTGGWLPMQVLLPPIDIIVARAAKIALAAEDKKKS